MSEFSKEIQHSTELFSNLIFRKRRSIWDFFKCKNKERDSFDGAMKKYINGLFSRYNTVQILGMREPVPLKSLLVRANILEKITARAGLRPEELAEFFDSDRRTFGTKKETVYGEIIVNKLKKFIVLGKPGAGKTTYLKYLTLMMLDKFSKIERRKLPIFITLRAWADKPMPLLNFIVEEFDHCGFEEVQPFVERLLENGDCLVLFDGLDEVSETARLDDIISQIKKFADKYAENQFIISCRVAAYNHWFAGFTEVEMADFNKGQMESFIRNWFHNEPKVSTECWERLKNNPPLRELASVPLLLTLLCLEYGESNNFPSNRSELYHYAIETLLTKWDSTRRVRRPEVYKKLTTKQKESMFARIAWGTFTENMYFIREMELTKMIEKFIEHLPGFKVEELEPDSKTILKAIETQHGIFVERAKGVYSFAHLTFQEYFTARFFVNAYYKRSIESEEWLYKYHPDATLEKLVEQHLYDLKWREVFLLTAGLLDNADELLLLMRRKADEALEIPEINALMETAEKSHLPVESKYPPVIRRNFAAFIALALALDFDRARDLGLDRVLDLDLARYLARVLDVDLDLDLARPFNFYHAHDVAFGFSHDLDYKPLGAYGKANKLNEQTVLKIQDYFSANILIINCLESANFVSKDVREKMLHEICLPKRG